MALMLYILSLEYHKHAFELKKTASTCIRQKVEDEFFCAIILIVNMSYEKAKNFNKKGETFRTSDQRPGNRAYTVRD
jgi:hypothetical protein